MRSLDTQQTPKSDPKEASVSSHRRRQSQREGKRDALGSLTLQQPGEWGRREQTEPMVSTGTEDKSSTG